MKILFLTRFGQQGASSRMRFFQYIPWLKMAAIDYVVSPLIDDEMLYQKYQHGSYNLLGLVSAYWHRLYLLIWHCHFDLVWIEKEALPWFPAWFERLMLRSTPYVLDFDDAIFHNYDLHKSRLVRCFYGRRIDILMANSKLVIAGNFYLADRALGAAARCVEVIPTVIDLDRYQVKRIRSVSPKLKVVWIGSPSTAQYLFGLAEPLAELAKRNSFTLRVIGAGEVVMPGVDVESVLWSADTEASLIAECDVGIMPLRGTPWDEGKCAYKLIQYMACGLPTVASPVGANLEVLIESKTGFFAETPSEWVSKLELLFSDVALRQCLGLAGRARVMDGYCLQQVAPRLVQLLTEVGAQ